MLRALNCLLLLAVRVSPEILDLADLSWRLRGGEDERLEVEASLPGSVYTDLQTAGVLADLLYRFNDVEYRWVSQYNWTYHTVLALSQSQLDSHVVQLDCHGLDTAATVIINGKVVANTNNMFIRYILDVKPYLMSGENSVEIKFQSPVEFSRLQYELQTARQYPVPPACVPEEYHGECHANHIRKMQAAFSWDWGPAFPSSGVWLPLQLVLSDSARLQHVRWEVAELDSVTFTVNISAVLVGPPCPQPSQCLLEFQIAELELEGVLAGTEDVNVFSAQFTIPKAEVELWWPNGHGNQKLYDLRVLLRTESDTDHLTRKVGFRTVELVQEPLVEGLSFYFRVNGKQIFMKGSNWIPAHVIPRSDPDYYYQLLYSAKEANMNMLRVWGGGIYELDNFYEIADELGIMIWQDFMFACAMYPADEETLEVVREEVRHQVRRLQHHASIALWAANNENEAALRGNWYGTDRRFSDYKSDYVKLYVEVVRDETLAQDSSRSFLVSSPGNGAQSEAEGFIAADPYSSLYGDTHFYNYRDNNWDWTIYPQTRFASEYGFQSFPAFEVLEPVSEVEDWSVHSAWMSHRQHHPNGNMELLWQISLNMDLDQTQLDTVTGFQEFLYLSQVYQAVSLKTETETYRRGMRDADPVTGEGLTMGALYWQLNDIWQAASWSSLEFGGQWKLSHYFAERFFRPTIVSPVLEGEDVKVWVVCDLPQSDLTLTLNILHYDSFSPSYSLQLESVECEAPGSVLVHQSKLTDLLRAGNCSIGSYDDVRLEYCLLSFSLSRPDSSLLHDNHLMSAPRSLSTLQPAHLLLTVTGLSNEVGAGPYLEVYNLQLHSDNIALYVLLTSGECRGRFSDNGFVVTKQVTELKFHSKDHLDLAQLQNCVSVRSYTKL